MQETTPSGAEWFLQPGPKSEYRQTRAKCFWVPITPYMTVEEASARAISFNIGGYF